MVALGRNPRAMNLEGIDVRLGGQGAHESCIWYLEEFAVIALSESCFVCFDVLFFCCDAPLFRSRACFTSFSRSLSLQHFFQLSSSHVMLLLCTPSSIGFLAVCSLSSSLFGSDLWFEVEGLFRLSSKKPWMTSVCPMAGQRLLDVDTKGGWHPAANVTSLEGAMSPFVTLPPGLRSEIWSTALRSPFLQT